MNGNNIIDETHGRSTMVYSVLNITPGTDYSFRYRIPYQLFYNTDGSACMACKYKLEIRIEGPGIDDNTGPSTILTELVYTGDVYPPGTLPVTAPACTTDAGSYFEWVNPTTYTFTEAGSYTIYKTLIWDKDAALDAVLASLDPLVNSTTAAVQQAYNSQFSATVEEDDCDFLLQNSGHTYPTDEYNEVFSAMADGECRSIYNRMLGQVSPGGYFITDTVAGGTYQLRAIDYTNGHNILDVLSDDYGSSITIGSTTYTLRFLLPDGTDILEPVYGPSPYTFDDGALDLIIQYWRPEWADLMVIFEHPEYCHYTLCTRYSGTDQYTTLDESNSSVLYDLKMVEQTGADIQYSGTQDSYMNPQRYDSPNYSAIAPYYLNPYDPGEDYPNSQLSTRDPYPDNIGDDINAEMEDYLTDQFGNHFSIWEFSHPFITTNPVTVAAAGYNNQMGNTNIFNQPFDLSTTNPDADNILWNLFRGSYLQAKTQFRYDAVRLQNTCPILSDPHRIVLGSGGQPEDENDISQMTNDILNNIFNTPPGTPR
ncbi:MAG: hypothetical protein HC905_20035 [Bacteroidales bacterium]|nr:hypothetical protein [Bacteroidales bacterium]